MRRMLISVCIILASAVILQVINAGAIPAAGSDTAKRQTKIWVKDPFEPPPFYKVKDASGAIQSPAAEHVALSAILYSRNSSSAMINGQIVRVGDTVAGYKVVDIKKTYVILSGQGRRVRLDLKR